MSIKISIKCSFKILVIISPYEPQQNSIEMNLLCTVLITLKVKYQDSHASVLVSFGTHQTQYSSRFDKKKKHFSTLRLLGTRQLRHSSQVPEPSTWRYHSVYDS